MSEGKIRLDQERLLLGALGSRLRTVGLIIGLIGIAAGTALGAAAGDNLHTFWFSYLTAFIFWLTLSLGALVFIAIQYATRASWSVVVRRIAEFFAMNLVLLLVLALPVLLIGAPVLYEWLHPEAAHGLHAQLLAHKAPYLNQPFWIIRVLFYFAAWITLARYFFTRSLSQDKSGDPEITRRMWITGGPALVIFALTSTFAAFDLVMSLSPGWFSTMFGVYFFAGSMLGFMALLGATALWLQSRGHLTQSITLEHYHDIGKLTFAFTIFWAYIAFSQFMLIWYGNLPEETEWYHVRQTGTWLIWEAAMLFGQFFIPFLGLLSRWVKRRRPLLAFWCVWVLVWHWVDVVYLVLPNFSPAGVPNLLPSILMTIGLGGLYVAAWAFWANGRPIMPVRDPRLIESLQFDNVKV